MKDIAVILCENGVQDEEYIYPYYRLQETGFEVITATPDGLPKKGKYGIPIKNGIINIKDIYLYSNIQVVIVPGGWECPEKLRMNQDILEFIRVADNANITIGAICHGPQVLISAGIIDTLTTITGYQGIKDDIKNSGAIYEDKGVVVDYNLVTAQHYKNNPEFMIEVLKVYNERKLSRSNG